MIKWTLWLVLTAFVIVIGSGCSENNEGLLPEEEMGEEDPNLTPEEWVVREERVMEASYDTKPREGMSTPGRVLTLVMDDRFWDSSISEQYHALVDVYEAYNTYFASTEYSTLHHMDVYVNASQTGNKVYTIYTRTATIEGEALSIDRPIGGRLEPEQRDILNSLDRSLVLQGEQDEGPSDTIITVDGVVKGRLAQKGVNDTSDAGSFTATGVRWNGWSSAVKTKVVASILRVETQGGRTFSHEVPFYVEALDAFYKDGSMNEIEVREALLTVSKMSP